MNKTKRAWTARMRREGRPEELIFLYHIFGYQSKLAFYFFDRVLGVERLWFGFYVFIKTNKFFIKAFSFFSQPITQNGQQFFFTQNNSPDIDSTAPNVTVRGCPRDCLQRSSLPLIKN